MLNKELLMMGSAKQPITITVSYYAKRWTDLKFEISNKVTNEVYYKDNAVPLDVNTISVSVPTNAILDLWTNAGAMTLLRIEPSETRYELEGANRVIVYTKDLDCTIDIEIPR